MANLEICYKCKCGWKIFKDGRVDCELELDYFMDKEKPVPFECPFKLEQIISGTDVRRIRI